MLRGDSSVESNEKKNELNANGDDDDVTSTRRFKPKRITRSRRRKSMMMCLKKTSKKKITKRQRNRKITILPVSLLKSPNLLVRWLNVRFPAQSQRQTNNAQENVYDGIITITSSQSGLVNPYSNLQAASNSVSSGSSGSGVEAQAQVGHVTRFPVPVPQNNRVSNILSHNFVPGPLFQRNVTRSSSSQPLVSPAVCNYQQLYHPSSASTSMVGHVTRMATATQRPYDHPNVPVQVPQNNQFWNPSSHNFVPRPFYQRNVTNHHTPTFVSRPITSSIQSQSNATMPSYQQQNHHPSSSSVNPPQNYLANSSSAGEFRPYVSRQQTAFLRRGVDPNLPPRRR